MMALIVLMCPAELLFDLFDRWSAGERERDRSRAASGCGPPGTDPEDSEVPGEGGPVRSPLLQERVAPFDGLVGHVGEAGGLAGEQLLTDQPVVDGVERVLEHALCSRGFAVISRDHCSAVVSSSSCGTTALTMPI